MARCKQCGKRGWFLKLDNYGRCMDCQAKYFEEIKLKRKIELQNKQRKEMQINIRMSIQNKISDLPVAQVNLSQEKVASRPVYELRDLKYSNITPKGKYPEIVVIDAETTGISASKDRIVELSAVRFVNSEATEMFTTLVNPMIDIPAEATSVNGITNEMVAGCAPVSQIITSFDSFVGSSDVVAHNLAFDLKFIHKAGSKLTDTSRRYFCTMEQAQRMLKKPKYKWDKEYEFYDIDYDCDYDVENHKLGTLCEYFNIYIPNQHRSFADAYCTGLLFFELVNLKQNRV